MAAPVSLAKEDTRAVFIKHQKEKILEFAADPDNQVHYIKLFNDVAKWLANTKEVKNRE